jgi:hypothetical protein
MFGQKCQGKVSRSRTLEDNVSKDNEVMVTHLRARHDMSRLVSSILLRVRHVMIMYVMAMHVM